MAIKANFSGVQDQQSLLDPLLNPANILAGDMLYFDKTKNLFVTGRPPVVPTQLGQLTNDVGFVTNSQLQTAIIQVVSGGEITLDGYATEDFVTQLLSGLGDHFSGDYNDLINKPAIPTVPSSVSAFSNDAGYVTGAQVSDAIDTELSTRNFFSGDYTDLINKPAIFSGNYADLINQPVIPSVAGLASTVYVDNALADLVTVQDISGLASIEYVVAAVANVTIDLSDYATQEFVNSAIVNVLSGGSIDLSDYVTTQDLASALADYQPSVDLTAYALKTDIPTPFSGDYNDLTNRPVLLDNSLFVTQGQLTNTLTAYQPITDLSVFALRSELFSGSYADLTNKPNQFSGDYNDLINKPAIFSGNYADLINQPVIPSVAGLASVAYVDQQIANVATGGNINLDGYATDLELATAIANLTLYVDTEIGNVNNGGEPVDLTGYATQTYVNQQIAAASLTAISSLNDLSDVAISDAPTQTHALMYNPFSGMWEDIDLEENFASKIYLTQQLASFANNGTIDLEGYATEDWVDQRLLERGPHFSGNYDDLTNRPILFSGNYADLTNKPTDTANLRLQVVGSQLRLVDEAPNPDKTLSTVDLSVIASSLDYSQLNNLPTLFSGNYADLTNRPTLFSGNYNDLNNKPYIPSIAGLASETYVNNRWAEPEITGDRFFTDVIEFQKFVQIKTSTVDHDAIQKSIVLAVQTTNDIETEVLDADGARVTVPNGAAMFKATFVADDGDETAAFVVHFIANKRDNITQVIGANVVEIIADSSQGWSVGIDTYQSSALSITVTGSAETTVDWTIFLEISAVKR